LSFNIKLLCLIANVSPSGYYKWLKTKDEPDKDYPDYLIIKAIFDAGHGKYGVRAILMKLLVKMNHKKVSRIMKKYNLICQIRKPNPYKAQAKKTLAHKTCPNLLQREFKSITPFKVFCTDITYIFFSGRPAYLSVIKDIASGEIVGWSMSRHLEMNIVLETLENMKNNSLISFQNIMIHSDQGFHYTNPQYQQQVANLNMIQSMSRKGNCLDNAPMESFFGHLKDDVDYQSCKTYEALRLLISQYMKYYNYKRPQWNLGKLSPVDYRDQLLAQK
jgi:transposase InsO family protein